MALTDRDRARLRTVLDTVLRADDVVMEIAETHALSGRTAHDDDLDGLHDALSDASERLERLLGIT